MKTRHEPDDTRLLPCQQLDGVGKRMAERLSKMGIHHVEDLLFHLPLRYQDRTRLHAMKTLLPGEHVVVEGTIDTVTTPLAGRTRLLIRMKDETGHCHLRFFYVNASQRHTLKTGVRLRCFGEVRLGTHGIEMIHPEYRIVTPNEPLPVEKNLTPIYPTTEGISQMMLRKWTEQALQLLNEDGLLRDILPSTILQAFQFPSLKEALQFVHRPPVDTSPDALIEGRHPSQKRLVFEELLAHRLSLLHLKKNFQIQSAHSFKNPGRLIQTFLKSLPFQLTNAQQKVTEEVARDLTEPHPMLRLLQGDVGSGKTVVAAMAILQAVESGYQAAVLAPTELLAEQHFQTFRAWFSSLNIKVVLLSGHMKVSARREALDAILKQQADVVIGTHAIFQKEVQFATLSLVIVDEQHRFGVEQRALLREKGMQGNHCPHQLIMTATPIPRTLAMSVYADLDCSVMDELPPGRTPVTTRVLSNARRDEVLLRIREACASGRQAYWVCTLIEESDVLQCKAAEKTAEELRLLLSELQIGLLHGRMKSAEKDAVMSAFKKGELHLLVATTVIEVGVDVPNASLMVIDNAERLGLAQLHQLRGRVGRGAMASHCLLMYQMPLSHLAKARLHVMRETTDGFRIAERDLELRGPGEVLGTKQTGDVSLRIADLLRDSDLLPAVSSAATVLQRDHAELIDPLIRRWLKSRERFGHV
ncbi:MAG TPA: ATP-dependent DNA helicase RecG [Gammaproteobacteria bacterium]|nr:ATP-dependent DNA helicase RecG [Gammaproteobacteria bacterium]